MRVFLPLFWSELRAQLRRPGPHVFAGMYAALGVLLMVAVGGAFKSVSIGIGAGNVCLNASGGLQDRPAVADIGRNAGNGGRVLTHHVGAETGSGVRLDQQDVAEQHEHHDGQHQP